MRMSLAVVAEDMIEALFLGIAGGVGASAAEANCSDAAISETINQ